VTGRRVVVGALAAALLLAGTAGAARVFVPNDPLASRQWYITKDRAFDYWTDLPQLSPVRVAVIDSGIDLGHPEFQGRIVASKSFVGGSVADHQGHGTFVAGEIAAALDNAQGIAGIAFPADLLIAKVVASDGTILPGVEAKAIRWAVARGAQVINLSIGGIRDPLHPSRDTYSALERGAIEYARSQDVVVVAAVGNSDQAPEIPWHFASYPAALPHVIGVSALAQDGSIPSFSNRDSIYNDIAAPGDAILSTFPRSLTADRPSCVNQGYSDCGPAEYHDAEGTSFAAPQVAAAAALLLAVQPGLTSDQVAALLEHSAVDVSPATGCRRCGPARDALSGWGRLDVTAALTAADDLLPEADRYEANDDAGVRAATIYGRKRRLQATVDFWDDQIDVYRVKLRKAQRMVAALRGPAGHNLDLVLWKPGTEHVDTLAAAFSGRRLTQSAHPGPNERVVYKARAGGWYYLEVKITAPGYGAYSLEIAKKK
jgi:subtilisin family serine protease